MRDRRVVYDSEDEDEGFSPVNSPVLSPVKGGADDVQDRAREGVAEPTSDSRSTDPEFFKQIYEAQLQQVATEETVPDTEETASRQPGPSGKQTSSGPKAKDNSSSLTDPTLKSAKKRAAGGTDASKDLAGLTQVTTPSAPSAKQRDVYDFPLSDGESSMPPEPAIARTLSKKKAAAAKGKRRREQQQQQPAHLDEAAGAGTCDNHSSPPRLSAKTRGSSPSRAIQIEDDGSSPPPRPARKRRKGSARRQDQRADTPDDVDLLVIPTTADMDNLPPRPDDARDNEVVSIDESSSSRVADTLEMTRPPPSREPPPASFIIAPLGRLSASQKQEYLRVSGCSELDGRDDDEDEGTDQRQDPPSLPPPRPVQTQDNLPPNTDSTIPYPTPSRYCPSAPPLPLVSSSHLPTSSERRTQADAAQPQSSPDELNAHSPGRIGRSSKRKRSEQDAAQDDPWDSDDIGVHRETYVPRPSKRGARAVVEDDDDDDDDLDAPDQAMPDTCPPGDDNSGRVTNTGSEPVSGNHAPQDGIEGIEGLDSEFLEAMPEDIRREIISNHAAQQSARTSQAPQTRSRGRPKGSSSGSKPVSEEAPQPKKRGRKKKGQKDEVVLPLAEEAIEEQLGPAITTTTPTTTATTTAKRKRGRPKKGDAIQPPPASEFEDPASIMETTDAAPDVSGVADAAEDLDAEDTARDIAVVPKASSRRGRKKKAVKKTTAPVPEEPDETALDAEAPGQDDSEAPELAPEHRGRNSDEAEGAEEEEGREALRDISNTASQSTPATSKLSHKGVQQEVTPEPKVKDAPRSASTTGQGGKVAFRVGLSKKSRITPLLKMIRK